MNSIPPRDNRRNLWIAGALAVALGLFMVLLSLGVIEGWPVNSGRALFNDPRHWQLTAFGLVFALTGVSLWIPRQFEAMPRCHQHPCLVVSPQRH